MQVWVLATDLCFLRVAQHSGPVVQWITHLTMKQKSWLCFLAESTFFCPSANPNYWVGLKWLKQTEAKHHPWWNLSELLFVALLRLLIWLQQSKPDYILWIYSCTLSKNSGFTIILFWAHWACRSNCIKTTFVFEEVQWLPSLKWAKVKQDVAFTHETHVSFSFC